MSNLSALGLVPAVEHPDAELFRLIARQKARHEAWNAARGEAAHRRLLAEWRKDNSLEQEARIAQFVPVTLEGLIEKADAALQSWREDEGETRYMRMWATMATALEQVLEVLRTQQSVDMPARYVGSGL